MMRTAFLPALALASVAILLSPPLARAGQERARLEALSRSIVDRQDFAAEAPAAQPAGGLFRGDIGARFKHGFWSLLVPGWSQYRAGQTGRAGLFAGVELGVWTSYAVFELQGHRRRDSYQDWAVQFASVQDTNPDEDYWRAVALFDSNEDYNESVRRDLRVGVSPDGPQYFGDDAWLWRNDVRQQDYRVLRAQSQDAFDRANLTLLFAVLNRLVSFIDALRTAPVGTSEFSQPPADRVRLQMEVSPSVDGPTTVFKFQAAF